MSDAIETGARRRLQNLARPRTEAISKRKKIDRSKDEFELEQITDVTHESSQPATKATTSRKSGSDEVELGRFTGKTIESSSKQKSKSGSRSPKSEELELGRFTGKVFDEAKPNSASTSSSSETGASEVVGPKRQRVVSDDAKAARRKAGTELEIASTRDITDDAEPSRGRAKRRSSALAGGQQSWTGLGILTALGIVLVILTALTFLLMPRYQPVGEPLIAKTVFNAGLAAWRQAGDVTLTEGDPRGVRLKSEDASAHTSLIREIELPPGDSLMVLRAQVQGQDVVPGPEYWDQARIYLAQISPSGDVLWGEDHRLFVLNGSTGIRNYSEAFSIPDEIEVARLGIELKNATGQLTVNELSLEAAERPLSFIIAAGFLLIGWSALVLFSACRLLGGIESAQIRAWLGTVFVLSIIALLLPGYIYEEQLSQLAYQIGIEDFDAIGHGVMFTVLALLVRLGRPQDPIWLHAGLWLLIAVASEVLQLFTVDREPSLIDLVLDGVGVLIGLVLAETNQHMRRFRTA